MQPLTCLVLGDINIDFSLQTPLYPPEGGRTHAEHANFRLGGSGCMTAMTLSRLGCATALAGNLGSDVLGDWSLGRIAATGTDCRFIRRLADQQTGFFMLVATPGGSQTTFGSRGANALPLPADEIIPDLANFKHLHISGYTLAGEDQFHAVRRILGRARQAGLSTSLDPGVCSSAEAREKILSLLPDVNYLLPNEFELRQLAGDQPPDAQVGALLALGCEVLILKMGERGSRYTDAGHSVSLPAVQNTAAAALAATGAGDCFNAGFLKAILTGASPGEALQAGNEIAFRKITNPGEFPG